MARLVTSLTLCFLAYTCINAQGYVPLPRNGIWTGAEAWTPGPTGWSISYYRFTLNTDTVISGTTYAAIKNDYFQWNSPTYHGALRNDSIAKMVFFIPADSINERLLYDFNLTVGDTIRTNFYAPVEMYVTGVDSVLVAGTMCKRLAIQTPMGEDYWIEGVGSTSGLLFPYSALFFEQVYTLCTLWDGGELIFNPSSSLPGMCLSSTPEIAIEQRIVYPNPSTGIVYLSGQETRWSLKSISGILLDTGTASEVDLSALPAGIYLLQTDGFVQKVMKVH